MINWSYTIVHLVHLFREQKLNVNYMNYTLERKRDYSSKNHRTTQIRDLSRRPKKARHAYSARINKCVNSLESTKVALLVPAKRV